MVDKSANPTGCQCDARRRVGWTDEIKRVARRPVLGPEPAEITVRSKPRLGRLPGADVNPSHSRGVLRPGVSDLQQAQPTFSL